MAAKKVVPLPAKKKPPEPQPEPLTQEARESISDMISELERTLSNLNALLYVADDFCFADHKDDEWEIALGTLIRHIKEVAEKAKEQGEQSSMAYFVRHKGDYR